jgi:hypothetical protein
MGTKWFSGFRPYKRDTRKIDIMFLKSLFSLFASRSPQLKTQNTYQIFQIIFTIMLHLNAFSNEHKKIPSKTINKQSNFRKTTNLLLLLLLFLKK